MAISKQKLEAKFKEVYKGLNEQQRVAVDTIEGPVMVIAGPGTGKTQILAARIGKILLDTDASPENIICLTYTDAGVVAMRKRLQQFIGAEAYKVNLFTFHAFCNEVIQDNLSYFEKTALDPVSDLEQTAFLKQLIDAFPQNHPLKRYRGDVYYDATNLQNLFSAMKREGWSTEFLNQKIDEYRKSLEDDESLVYKKKTKNAMPGDKKPAYYKALDSLEKLKAAVNEFDNYQQILHQNKRYDFDDMINWVIRAFEDNANMLAEYQEKFQYILVDEFQDTSGTQNRIVQLLISYWDEPNVFVVGDDDQSIYRFQGANVENMLHFANNYVDSLRTIVLTNNYRSTQPILDVSKTLIENNADRLVKQLPNLSKELMAANKAINHLLDKPEIIAYSSVSEEMVGIVLKIESLIQQGIAPGRIAVIYRENKYGEELAGYFSQKNIPIYSKRKVDLLKDPFVKKLITILTYLDAEHDMPYGGDELLFEILHFDFYKIPPIEIAKLTNEVYQKKIKGEQTSIRQLLFEKANAPAQTLFDAGCHEGLKKISAVLEQLIADVSNLTIQQLLDHIIRNAGVLSYVMNNERKIKLMQYLTSFFDFVKEENRRNPDLNLRQLIQLIQLMEHEGLVLPALNMMGNEKGVNLLTAHGSKGLEFEYVFVVGCNASVWEKKKKNNRGFKLPSNVFTAASADNDLAELRRLFFVALTRAEKHLCISYASHKNDGKDLEPSMFIAEILEQHSIDIQNTSISEEAMTEFHFQIFSNRQPVMENLEDDFLDGLLSKFVMNVTALNNYLDCPIRFYYNNVLRIPSGKSEILEFGSAVHYALEKLFKEMKEQDTKEFPPVEFMLNAFKWYMNRSRENFTKEAFDRRMEQGSIIIPAYYKKYVDSWNKFVCVELNVKGVVIDGVPLKGKLDKLEFNGSEVNVVDYKTGGVDNASKKLVAPNEKNPNGGDYWRQAVFYKILVENYPSKNWKVNSVEFDFIEPDNNNEYQKKKVVITPADVTTVKQQIVTTWNNIQEKKFNTGCGKDTCQWCNFVKDNYLYTELLNGNSEDEAEEY